MQGDDHVATKTLQWVCERCRAGAFFPDASRLRPYFKSCLYRASINCKRWAVNALGAVGLGSDVSPILALLAQPTPDPDLIAAIVAAIFSSKSEDEAMQLLARKGVEMTGLALIAASQHSLSQKRVLVQEMIPLETDDPAVLRAAIVLTGLGKAPEHLFHDKLTNAIALSELNRHHEPTVSKYSIWSMAQLRLGFGSLQIPEADLEASPEEVRKWAFRLLVSNPYNLARKLDLFSIVPKDPSVEVREEVAIELRDHFAPGVDNPVAEWFFSEEHAEARALLLDHMAAQSDRSAQYSDVVVEIYKGYAAKSDDRVRIEAAAATTDLYSQLRRIDIEDEKGRLFANDNFNFSGGPAIMVKNFTQNVTGNTIGALSGVGDVHVDTVNLVSKLENADVRDALLKSLEVIQVMANPDEKAIHVALVEDTAKDPTPGKWAKLLGVLKGIKTGTVAVAGAIGGIDKAIDAVGAFV